PGNAQAQETAALTVEGLDQSQHPEVSLTVGMPRPMVGTVIPQDAFSVLENGAPRKATVERLPTEALDVVLLLDLSQSMTGTPLAAAKESALAFVDQMPPDVRIAIVGFASGPTVVSDFTTDAEATRQAIGGLSAAGETALYDGLVAGAGLWGGDVDGARRSLILLSDGADTVSASSLEDSIVSLLAADASFYAVELQSPESDPIALQRLESATGGALVGTDDPEALAAIFDEIASVLVNQYRISFTSGGGGPTTIEVSATANGLTASGSTRVQFPNPPPIFTSPEADLPPIAQPAPAPPLVATEVKPGLLAKDWAVLAGASLVFAGLFGLLRLGQTHAGGPGSSGISLRGKGSKTLEGITNRATLFAERTLENRSQTKGLAASLEQAGITLRGGEFVVLAASFALGVAAVLALFFGFTVGIAGGLASPLLMRFIVSTKARRRKKAFADQLSDALQLIAGGLLAGHGILQSIDAVSAEELPPSSDEFRRLVAEVQLGRDLTEALHAMSDRVGGEDFSWVVDAIEIHREVGGDLADILQTVAETIRDRNQIRRRILSLSAEGRLSGFILMALPFFVAAFVSITNPSYMAELTESPAGRIMIVGSLAFMGAGALWIRRIVRLQF
ncbi:MAG: type II secretion system F family protein, partial [Myxococcales bacterium]|nr:type II secretion system F family protein [Myxococcales bacterium]